MALPVTMYRWDDVGAPQIVDGKPSEYMNVLKKCLVEGYGSKESLGWTVVDDIASPPFLSLRNNTSLGGSGGVAVFSANDDSIRENVKVECCQDYVDKNNLVRKSASTVFYAYSTPPNLNNRWFIIGTGKAFYFFVCHENIAGFNYTGTSPSFSFFIGDFESLYPNDPATFIFVTATSSDNISTNWTKSLHYITSQASLTNLTNIYALDGSNISSEASLSVTGGRSFVSGKKAGIPNITTLSKFYILMGDGNLEYSSNYQNQVMPFSRGLLPGFFVANSPGYRDEPMPVIKKIDNIDHYLLPSTSNHTGCAWINLEQW